LEFKLNKIAFNLFGIPIAWYAVIIVTGILVCIFLSQKDDGLYKIKWEDIIDMMVFVLPISILCARLYYVIFNFDVYRNDLINVINIRDGGLAIYGGLIGRNSYMYYLLQKK